MRDGILVDITETAKIITNIQVINKIYDVANVDELLNDEPFMLLITTNGYYKAAFCDKFELESAVVTIASKTYKFIGMQPGLDIRDLVMGNSDIIPLDVELVDEPI